MANSAIVGILRALLTANTAEFDTAMKRSAESAKAWSRDLKSVGTQASQVGLALSKTLTLPIVGAGAAIAKVAMDFESSFAGVRKTVDATEPEFAKMSQGFRELAKQIPINVNELNRLGEAAGALNVPKEEIVDFSRVMALLGVTTNVTSDQAAESIAQIQTIFQRAGKETENFASTLVDLGNKGASTEAQILELANRIASAGNAVGMSQAEVLGFSAAIANVGINAEAGGSAISKVFSDMSIAVSKGGEKLKDFAKIAELPAEAFAKLFKEDAAEAVRQFVEGIGKAHKAGADMNLILAELGFEEVRQARALRDLALSGENLGRSIGIANTAWKENSALGKEAGERFKTVASQLTLLWNSIQDVAVVLGEALLPAIRNAIGLVKTFLPVVEFLAKAFVAMPEGLQLVAIGFLAIVAAVGPVLFVFGQVVLAAGAVAGAFTKTGIAMKGVTAAAPLMGRALTLAMGPVGQITAAAGLLAAALVVLKNEEAERANNTQIAGARQDVVTLAMARYEKETGKARDTVFSYAEALKYNNDWYQRLMATGRENEAQQQRTTGSTETLRQKVSELGAALKAAEVEIGQLSDSARADLITAIKSGAFSMEDLEKASGLSSVALKLFKDRVEETGKKTDDLGDKLRELSRQYDSARERGLSIAQIQRLMGSEIASTTEKAELQGVAIPQNLRVIAAAYGKVGPEIEALSKALDDFHAKAFETAKIERDAVMAGIAARAEWHDKTIALTRDAEFEKVDAIEATRDAEIASLRGLKETNKAVYDQITEEIRKNAAKQIAITLGATQTQEEQLRDLGFQTKFELDQIAENARNTYLAVSQAGTYSASEVAKAWDAYRKAERARMGEFAGAIADILEGIPDMLIRAFTGGGGFMGALKGIGVQIAEALLSPLKRELANWLSRLPRLLSSMGGGSPLTATMGIAAPIAGLPLFGAGGAAAGAGGTAAATGMTAAGIASTAAWTAGIGLAAFALWKFSTRQTEVEKKFIAIKARWEEAVRLNTETMELRDAFIAAAGGMDTLNVRAQVAGVTLKAVLDAKTPQEYKEAVDDLNAALEFQDNAAKILEETISKYGITISELGPAFAQQKLHESAMTLIQDYEVLKAAGVDHNKIVEKMGPNLNAYVKEALKAGLEIPKNLQPVLQSLAEQGELVDENGEKMTDLSRLKFSETLEAKFETIIQAIGRLVEAIERHLNPTLRNIPKAPNPFEEWPAELPDYGSGGGGVTGGLPGGSGGGEGDISYGSHGGLVTKHGIRRMVGGGFVGPSIRAPWTWPKIGRDVHPAMLAENEFVLDTQRLDRVVSGLEAGAEMTRNLAASKDGGDLDKAILDQLRAIEAAVLAGRETVIEVDQRELARAVNRANENGGAIRTETRDILGIT